MNRTGLFIALGLAARLGMLFGVYPELDLKLAALFYDPTTKTFPLKFDALARRSRAMRAMWIAWATGVAGTCRAGRSSCCARTGRC